jgi:hypothetical protein
MSSHRNFKRCFDICILQSRQIEIESQLLPSGVAVEKLALSANGPKSGDRNFYPTGVDRL